MRYYFAPPRHESARYPKSRLTKALSLSNLLLEEGRQLFEEEVAHSAQDAGVVGVDADQEADSGADEEVED